MTTTVRARPRTRSHTAFLGMLVLDRRGRVHDVDPAVRDAILAPGVRRALLDAARDLPPGDAWTHHVLRLPAVTVRARLLREPGTGRLYALLGIERRVRPLDERALTARERQVARLLGGAQHRSDAQLARRLGVTERTVRWHVTNILRKARLASRDELRAAVAAGL